jgi:hypothetical protein
LFSDAKSDSLEQLWNEFNNLNDELQAERSRRENAESLLAKHQVTIQGLERDRIGYIADRQHQLQKESDTTEQADVKVSEMSNDSIVNTVPAGKRLHKRRRRN